MASDDLNLNATLKISGNNPLKLSIVVPPGQGGVRDFANVLASAMQHEHAVQVTPWQQDADRETMERMLAADCVYLQYSGYGYARRGAPLWLLHELRRNQHRIKRLGVFFHELYAFGQPWSSAFWLSPMQRHVACELAKFSDFWLTNRDGSAQWLRRHAGNKPHAVMPVFSNVGEMSVYTPDRAPKIVVFGSAALRLATYRASGDALFAWARRQGLTIHDIGQAVSDAELSQQLRDGGVVVHGRLPESEISHLLQDAEFGLVAYPVNYVPKSGVFAAYCAHGLCPVLLTENSDKLDAVVSGEHYLRGIPIADIGVGEAKRIGRNAWQWYQSHSLKKHDSIFLHLNTA